MKHVNIGGSSLESSVLGLGCMRIGNMNSAELSNLINKCIELEIILFDHADIYGGGICEEMFGMFLEEHKELRKKMIIQSKCGIRKGFFDLSKEYIIDSAENILRRLKTDYIDILLLHRPDTLMEPDEIAEAFNILSKSGKVRFFGVSNMNPVQISFLQEALDQKIIVNQLQFGPAHTGMIDKGIYANMTVEQSIDRDGGVLEYCRSRNITIQAWSPLQYGFFNGNFLGSEKYPELNAVINRVAKEKDVSAGAVAIAWILRHPAKMQVIMGSTKSSRIEDMAKATDIKMSREEWYEIYQAAGNKLP